jgi:PAS domain S-box-containing protein
METGVDAEPGEPARVVPRTSWWVRATDPRELERRAARLPAELQRERQLLLSIAGMALLVFVPATFFMAATRLGANPTAATAILATYVALCGCCYTLARQGRVLAASHLLLGGSFGLSVLGLTSIGGVTGPHVSTFPLLVIAAVLLRGRRAAFGYAALACLFVCGLAVLESKAVLTVGRHAATPGSSAFAVVLYVVSAGVIIALADQQRRAAQLEAERVARIASANHDRLEQLIAESPDGLAWFDGKRRLMECNPEFSRLCASSPARLIGRDVGQMSRFDAESRMRAVSAMEQLAAGSEEQRFTLRGGDGPACIVEVRAKRVVLAGATEAFQWIARDVTERESAREARERLELELQAARRLEDIGRLAGGVAHDFNNLLTAVNANACLLEREPALSATSRRQLSVIRQAGERAAALTQQLLAFARRQVLEPQPLELRTAVETMVPLLHQMLGPTIELELRLGELECWVEADRSRLEQVLTNLVVNGRDAMPDGGKLSVEIGPEHVRGHSVLSDGPYVLLRVIDTGEGMDDATAERIFEPFFTTKPGAKGTGLGLATVHGIVRQSGGHVSVLSKKGAGAIFEVRLPRIAPPERVDRRESSHPAASEEAGVGTVLVVDDEPLVRQTVESVLELSGFRVLAADGPREAQEVLEGIEHLDLLVSDVVMPEESGPVLAERLRRRWPALRVLFMSGYADELNSGGRRVELPYQYLQKPFVPGELRRMVGELMGAEVPHATDAGDRVSPLVP